MSVPTEIAAIELKNKINRNPYQNMLMSALLPIMLFNSQSDNKKLITKDEKKIKTCALNSCKKEHNQRGAFCCVEHYIEHRRTRHDRLYCCSS